MRDATPDKQVTPDGRYIVVKGRLWRTANPRLAADTRDALVRELMQARRAVRSALASGDTKALKAARHAVNEAKVSLGERGPPWWDDGARDYNRRMIVNTPYREWYEQRSGSH